MTGRVAVLALAAVLSARCAAAQVTLDPGALDALRPSEPAPAGPTAGAPPPGSATRSAVPTRPAAKPATRQKAAALPAPSLPPPPPSLPPALVVPVRPAPAPPPVPIDPAATGHATPLPDGLRLVFAPAQSGLAKDDVAALRRWLTSLPARGFVGISAAAAGTPEDSSAARRLSLSRALAVRAVLLDAGVPSARLYVYALGRDGASPPDRCDVRWRDDDGR